MELQDQSTRIRHVVYLRMRGIHCHVAAIWPPELVLAFKMQGSGSVNQEMLDKCCFGVVNGRISVIRTFCLSEPLDFSN